MSKYNPCPCSSKLLYHKCCKRFHDGAIPENALQLMRSRFAAYALNLPDYIIETTHKDNPAYQADRGDWRKYLLLFTQHTYFDWLDVLEFNDGDTSATVKFTAHLRQKDQDVSFTEASSFVKEDGRWWYQGGEVTPSAS